MKEIEFIIAIMDAEGLGGSDYTINSNGVIFKTNVHLRSVKLGMAIKMNNGVLPFDIVASKSLIIKRMFLGSDEGLPTIVEGDMNISYNKIEKFTCGRTVDGDLIANNNMLYTLDSMPIVGRNIDLSDNKLTHLSGMQERIYGDLSLNSNRLKVVAGHTIDGSLFVSNNILINEPSCTVGGSTIFENNPCNPADDFDRARW